DRLGIVGRLGGGSGQPNAGFEFLDAGPDFFGQDLRQARNAQRIPGHRCVCEGEKERRLGGDGRKPLVRPAILAHKLPRSVDHQGLQVIVRVAAFVARRSVSDFKVDNLVPGFVDQVVAVAGSRLEARTHARREPRSTFVSVKRWVPLQDVDELVLLAVGVAQCRHRGRCKPRQVQTLVIDACLCYMSCTIHARWISANPGFCCSTWAVSSSTSISVVLCAHGSRIRTYRSTNSSRHSGSTRTTLGTSEAKSRQRNTSSTCLRFSHSMRSRPISSEAGTRSSCRRLLKLWRWSGQRETGCRAMYSRTRMQPIRRRGPGCSRLWRARSTAFSRRTKLA